MNIEIKCKGAKTLSYNKLIPFQGNLKQLSEENYQKLKKEILELGFSEPVSVWLEKGKHFLLNGHQRHKTITRMVEKEGYKCPPLPINLVEAKNIKEAKKKVLALTSQYGEITNDGLSEFSKEAGISFEEMKESFRFPEISFDDYEKLENPEKTGLCDEDEVPEAKQPKTVLGDIYELGSHRLMCGDSTSIDALEKLMDGEKADMAFTDPPYNQETEGGFKSSIGAALLKQSKEIEHLCDFNPEMFLNVLPTVFEKNKLNAYCFCNKDLVVDYLKWARDCGYAYNILIWKKPSAIPIGGSYRPDVEYLLVFRKSGIFNGGIKEVNYSKVLEHNRELNKVHPTMKPVEMIENQLKIASNENSIVTDLFGGSGSTLIACEKTNRKCFMMELDPHYCDVIVSRWENYTGQKAKLVTGSKELADGEETSISKRSIRKSKRSSKDARRSA